MCPPRGRRRKKKDSVPPRQHRRTHPLQSGILLHYVLNCLSFADCLKLVFTGRRFRKPVNRSQGQGIEKIRIGETVSPRVMHQHIIIRFQQRERSFTCDNISSDTAWASNILDRWQSHLQFALLIKRTHASGPFFWLKNHPHQIMNTNVGERYVPASIHFGIFNPRQRHCMFGADGATKFSDGFISPRCQIRNVFQ